MVWRLVVPVLASRPFMVPRFLPGLILWLWSVSLLQAANTNLAWRWSNPRPFGFNIADLAWRTNLPYVAVGEYGQLELSSDLSTWTRVETGTQRWLRSAVYFGTGATNGPALQLVVTGERGTVLTAESPFTQFAVEDLGTTNWLESVAASGSTVVAVGDNAAIFRRTDATNWAKVGVPFTQWLRGVCWRTTSGTAGVFVTVGEGGLIATSPDGLAWTTRNSGVTTALNRVTPTYSGFVAVGDRGVALTGTADGRTWRRVNLNATGNLFATAEELRADLPQPVGATLAVGDGEVRTWTTILGNVIVIDETAPNRPAPAPKTTLYNALYNGRAFIVGGAAGQILQGSRPSPFINYLVWSANDSSPRGFLFGVGTNAAVSTNITARWTNGTVTLVSTPVTNTSYVAVGDGPTIVYSDDGAYWSTALVPAGAQGKVLLDVAPRLDRWVAVGNGGTIIHSPVAYSPLVTTNRFTNGAVVTEVVITNQINTLGLAWFSSASPTTLDLRGVAAGPDLFVAAGSQGVILTSPTGTNWTQRTSPTTNLLASVTAWPGGWMAVGDRGTLLASTLGTDWIPVSSGTTNALRKVRWLGDRLGAVGEHGTLLVSTNGSAWQRAALGETGYLYDILREGSTFLAVGQSGVVWVSDDGLAWLPAATRTSQSLYGLSARDGQVVAVGGTGAILRAQVGPFPEPVRILQYPQSPTDQLFLFSGRMDQRFRLLRSTDLLAFEAGPELEITDPGGTLLLLDSTANDPEKQFYGTQEEP